MEARERKGLLRVTRLGFDHVWDALCPLPCEARGTEACVSAGEVPLLQRSQAQSQAAWEVPTVLGVGQAQVGAGLPGFPCLPFWKATMPPVCLVTPVSQGSVDTHL